jgi:hypothetical protein
MSNQFIQAVAASLSVMATHYATLTDKTDRSHMRRQISVSIRNATDHPCFGTSVSKSAKDLADERGIPIEKMSHANQNRWDPKRVLFAYEHMVPVKNLMYAVIAAPEKAEEILRSAMVVWVTRAENTRLNDLGYAHNRPDPQKCYEEAGIKVP